MSGLISNNSIPYGNIMAINQKIKKGTLQKKVAY